MEKLAIFGGNPVRTTPLSYGKQYIDREDIAAVTEALISPELTCGGGEQRDGSAASGGSGGRLSGGR